MNKLKSLTKTLAISAALFASLSGTALAQDSYIPNLQNSFIGWCAGQSYSAKVCKCAVSQAAVQIPPTAMASFLAAAEGQGTAALSTSVGVSTVQILTTCSATSSGSESGGMLNGLFGN